jgi:predicted transcriptional regulator
MPTAKETMVDIISRQPEDSSYDEILRELAYARMVERGLADSDAARTVTDSEVRSRIEAWQK